MKFGTMTLTVAGLALALALPLATVQAQTPEARPAGPAPGMMMQQHGGMMGGPGNHEEHIQKMCEDVDAHHAAMLAYAEAKLKITDAQKPAWTKFSETAKNAHANITKLCAEVKDQPAPKTLPERLVRAEKLAKAHYAQLEILVPAVEEMYKVLTPEQQKIADALKVGAHGHGHHGGGMQEQK
ncbi:MAG: Spy/CpxP family protein refolding chaperone [Rhodospirillaceae bacterium]